MDQNVKEQLVGEIYEYGRLTAAQSTASPEQVDQVTAAVAESVAKIRALLDLI